MAAERHGPLGGTVSVNPPRIVLVVNADWYFWSHRLALARALRERGCSVTVAAGVERGMEDQIEQAGFRFVALRLRRRSINPLRESVMIGSLYRLYRREQPDLVHHVTIKPVIYGSLAARWAGVPVIVNTVPGLGYTFRGQGFAGRVVRRIVQAAYRLALHSPRVSVIFQNSEDHDSFVAHGLVPPSRAWVIKGSGVDTEQFKPVSPPTGVPVVLFASRLLWDKGLGDLVAAGKVLRARGHRFRVQVAGVPDVENPRAIPEATVRSWEKDGLIEWLGLRDDIPAVMAAANIVVLPTSYPEGVPKVLIEAASAARPIVATDVPGCREIVRHGENGLLVPPGQAIALAEALATLLGDEALRARMGARGREIAVEQFSEPVVIGKTLEVYRLLLGSRWPIRDAGGAQ